MRLVRRAYRRRHRARRGTRRAYMRRGVGGSVARMAYGSRRVAAPVFAPAGPNLRIYKYFDKRSHVDMSFREIGNGGNPQLPTVQFLNCDPNTATPGLQVGTAVYERTGRSIRHCFLELFLEATYRPSSLTMVEGPTISSSPPSSIVPSSLSFVTTSPAFLHVALVYDIQPTGTIPVISDIWNDVSGGTFPYGALAPVNLAGRERFRVIWRKRLELAPYGDTVLYAANSGNPSALSARTARTASFTERVAMPFTTRYKTGTLAAPSTLGGLADVNKGAYYLITDTLAAGVLMRYRYRHCFLDLAA